MADDSRSELHRALADLNEGVRALSGLGKTHPSFVDELLERHAEDRAPLRQVSSLRRTTPKTVGTSRRGRSKVNHLALVK